MKTNKDSNNKVWVIPLAVGIAVGGATNNYGVGIAIAVALAAALGLFNRPK